MSEVHRRLRANRTVAIPGIAAATVAAVLGAVFGALWFLSLSGVGFSVAVSTSHPILMLYGFVYAFVLSVASLLIPRFRNVDPARRVAVRLCGPVLLVASVFARSLSDPGSVTSIAALAVATVAVSAMALYTWLSIGRPSGPLGAADPLVQLSVTVMAVTLLLHALLEHSGLAPFTTPGFVNLALFGAVGSMVLGVGIKTVHFRIELKLRRRLWWWIAPLQALGSALSMAAVLLSDRFLELLGAVSFTASLFIWVISLDALRVVRSGAQYSRMNERDRKRYEYFVVHFAISTLWALSASILSVLTALSSLTSGPFWYGLRDASIHAFTIGFVGNAILAYAPIMLPGLLTGRTPYLGLTFWPAVYLNAGNVLRMVWFLTGLGGPLLPWLASALYLAAIALALLMMHSLR
ncbi:MAG: hypothetical protein NYU90_06800 [Aigarchaeota archaeon]|nr:hypothetical protein [Candidatus Calditenuis fumarioli]